MPEPVNLKSNSASLPMNYTEPREHPPEISLFDVDNPLSIINLVPDEVRKAILNIPQEYFGLTEFQLRKEVDPDERDCRLKLTFWDEYCRTQERNVKYGKQSLIQMTKVYQGVCVRDYFYKYILPNPRRVAWMVLPPKDQIVAVREILDLGYDRLREIMAMSFEQKVPVRTLKGSVQFDARGEIIYETKINTRIMGQVANIVKFLHEQINGAAVKRIAIKQETKAIHQHQHQRTGPPGQESLEGLTVESLDALETRLLGIEERIIKTLPTSQIIDIAEEEEPSVEDTQSD